MKIFPNGTLYIIRGCACDPDYEHTLYFESAEAQHAYFLAHQKYIDREISYQRTKQGTIRVQHCADDLYDCNYIAFRNNLPISEDNPNKTFSSKWFYAFLDDVTYISPTTCEISYSIDVIQTWMFDYELAQCFVVREHSATDNIGDNLIPEDIDAGEMVTDGYRVVFNETECGMMVGIATLANGQVVEGGFYGNIFGQIRFQYFEPTGFGAMKDLLDSLQVWDNQNAITSIFMCPKIFAYDKTEAPSTKQLHITLPNLTPLTRSDGAPVKNNKVNTFPYTYLEITNYGGAIKTYGYEYFAENEVRFTATASYGRTVTLTLVPTGYKVDYTALNFPEAITFNDFPECAWSSSEYTNRAMMSAINTAVGALTGGLQGGIPGAIAGGLLSNLQTQMGGGGAANVVHIPFGNLAPAGSRQSFEGARVNRSSAIREGGMRTAAEMAIALGSTPIKPLSSTYHSCNGSDLLNMGRWGFGYAQMRPIPQFIDRIDDYFSRYGYKTNALKTPAIANRKTWNYIQTSGCKINPRTYSDNGTQRVVYAMNCEDEKKICSIFDHGITFWKNPEAVGDYSQDNSIG